MVKVAGGGGGALGTVGSAAFIPSSRHPTPSWAPVWRHCACLARRAPCWARPSAMPDGSGHPRAGSDAPHPAGWVSTGARVGPVPPQRCQPQERGELVLVAGDRGRHVRANLAGPASSTPPATAVFPILRPRAECADETASGAMSLLPICGCECLGTGRRGPFPPVLCHTTPRPGSVGPPTRPPHCCRPATWGPDPLPSRTRPARRKQQRRSAGTAWEPTVTAAAPHGGLEWPRLRGRLAWVVTAGPGGTPSASPPAQKTRPSRALDGRSRQEVATPEKIAGTQRSGTSGPRCAWAEQQIRGVDAAG